MPSAAGGQEREPARREHSVDELTLTEKRSADTRVRFTDGVKELFTPRYLVRAVGARVHYFLAYGLTYRWMVFLLSVLGYPLQKTIFMVVLTNLASFLGRLTIAVTADKFQRYATLMVALALYIAMSMVMSFALGFGPGLVVLFVIIMLIFQYANDLAEVFQQWIPELFPSETRAFAASFTSAFGRLAAALFPILVGALVAGGRDEDRLLHHRGHRRPADHKRDGLPPQVRDRRQGPVGRRRRVSRRGPSPPERVFADSPAPSALLVIEHQGGFAGGRSASGRPSSVWWRTRE